jgi:hypothetical protein
MRVKLKQVVNDVYWKKAEDYLKHFLKEKASKPVVSSSSSSTTTTSGAYGASTSSAPIINSVSNSHEAAARGNELQMPPQQRQQEPPRGQNQDNIPTFRDDQSKKRQAMNSASTSNKSTVQAKTVPPYQPGKEKSVPKSRAKGASTPIQQRKPSLTTTGAIMDAVIPVPVPVSLIPAQSPAPVEVVRQYNKLMELVDHAFGFDWTVTGSLLGDSTHATLTEEQRRLLYDSKNHGGVVDKIFETEGVCFPLEGWSHRNIVSSRVAWSRLRLGKKQNASVTIPANPVVASGLLSIPQVTGKKPITIESKNSTDTSDVDFVWYNEEKAEADVALAVLSEGTEIYIKSVLMKALHCARQRQNLDGIRIWHQQFASGDSKPTFSLRLGCDVERQIAQTEGNAAMTCKRMEEACERQSNVPTRDRILNNYTLSNATSMSDLALRPLLGNAVTTAELEGKRKFEIYGGKNCEEPPLGRLSKVAKLEVIDFQTGMALSRRGRRHQAATTTSTFFF